MEALGLAVLGAIAVVGLRRLSDSSHESWLSATCANRRLGPRRESFRIEDHQRDPVLPVLAERRTAHETAAL
jgi:hypothetical protein